MKKLLIILLSTLLMVASYGEDDAKPREHGDYIFTLLGTDEYKLDDDPKGEFKSITNNTFNANEIKIGDSQNASLTTIKEFATMLPENTNLEYKGEQPEYLSYVIVNTGKINIRKEPTTKAPVIKSASRGKKIPVDEKVRNSDGEEWYKLSSGGYLFGGLVAERTFDFEKSQAEVDELEAFIDNSLSAGKDVFAISAYTPDGANKSLKRKKDKYGNELDQSAVGKYGGENIYIPDGTIISTDTPSSFSESENKKKTYRVEAIGQKEPYLEIKGKNLYFKKQLSSMPNKVITIDIDNQNMLVYEKKDGAWKIISYAYSKTGVISKLGYKTPKGKFLLVAAKNFMYYNNAQGEPQGVAENALRFSGGGYIHGTPINNHEKPNKSSIARAREKSLGTVPGTRKCVRNTIDHSKFLMNWVTENNITTSKNFQEIAEPVAVIVY